MVPLVLAISGLIASATHLGTPANALYVITGIGRSPLSNEVVAAVAFLALGGVYWILSFRDDLRRPFRVAWLAATAAAGFVFVGYIAVAYSVPSVPTWNLPTAPLTLWLNALSSGPLVGLFGLLLARQEPNRGMVAALLALVALAAAVNAAVLGMQWQELPGIVTTTTRAVDLVPAMPLAIGAYAACEAVAVALGGIGALRRVIGTGDDPFAAAQRARIVRLALTGASALLTLAACFALRAAHDVGGVGFAGRSPTATRIAPKTRRTTWTQNGTHVNNRSPKACSSGTSSAKGLVVFRDEAETAR